MKKFLLIATCIFTVVGFSGCKSTENPTDNNPNAYIDNGTVSNPTEEATADDSSGDVVIQAPKIGTYTMEPQGEIVFNADEAFLTFTNEEIKAYEDFSKDFDIQAFKDLNQVSIAKIWIQYGISGAWDSEYNMYTLESLEENKLDRQTIYNEYAQSLLDYADNDGGAVGLKKLIASTMFEKVAEGEFIEETETTGYVLYQTKQETGEYVPAVIVLNKVDGVWRPIVNPVMLAEVE